MVGCLCLSSASACPSTATATNFCALPPANSATGRLKRVRRYALKTFTTVILVGSTGCGKTTQIPQYVQEAGWCEGGRVCVVTQPRRVAAIAVAQRVADELGVKLGEGVGYTVRFDDKTHPVKTRIKFCTDGLLLRELMQDPLLSKCARWLCFALWIVAQTLVHARRRYSVVMVDEAHERTVATEILLGLLKKVRRSRPDLRIIISSATIDAEAFYKHFHTTDFPATIMSVTGIRMFPIDIMYLAQPCSDYVQTAVRTVTQIHMHEAAGDVLVFMTGQVCARARAAQARQHSHDAAGRHRRRRPPAARRCPPQPLWPLPHRHSHLRRDAARATDGGVRARGHRREEGDCCNQHCRDKHHDTGHCLRCGCMFREGQDVPRRHWHGRPGHRARQPVLRHAGEGARLLRTRVACTCLHLRALAYSVGLSPRFYRVISLLQRAGRAGRVQSGKAYRLVTEEDYKRLSINATPEMQRTAMAPVILQLKALGIHDVVHFPFLSPPPADSMLRGLELLYRPTPLASTPLFRL